MMITLQTLNLAAAMLALASFAVAQPVVAPTPGRPDEIKKTADYTISNSFEFGYRFAEVSGNRDVYRSSVNYGNGVRLFEGQLRINTLDGKGKLFDEFSFQTTGAGQDPYQASGLRVEKNRLYRYDMQFRIVNYFNRLPSLWSGEHGLNSERIFQNHDLTLLPGRRFEILLGYDRNNQNGPGFSSESVISSLPGLDSGNFLRFATNLRRVNNQYRAGVNTRVAGLAITVMQAFDNYKEDTDYRDASGVPGIAANVQPVERLVRAEPIHGNTPVTTVNIRTENEHRIGFNGRFAYASGNRNFILGEELMGTGVAAALRQTYIAGSGKRAQGSGDFTVVALPSDKWTLTNATSINNTRISGDSALLEVSLFTNQSLRFEDLGIRHITNATELNFRPHSTVGLYGAYRHTSRRILSRDATEFPTFNFNRETVEQTNDVNAGVAGIRWMPVKGVRLSFDSEVGRAGRPLTPVSGRRFHTENARAQYRRKGLVVSANYQSRINDNSATLINHSSTCRQFGGNLAWSDAAGRFTVDAGYARLHLDTASGIFNFLPETGGSLTRNSLYTSNLNTVHFGGRAQFSERLTLYLGYTLAKDTADGRDAISVADPVMGGYPSFGFDGTNLINSFPLSYQSPQARLSVRLHDRLSWNFGWQFYNYAERFSGAQNYHAHVGYSSFRWNF